MTCSLVGGVFVLLDRESAGVGWLQGFLWVQQTKLQRCFERAVFVGSSGGTPLNHLLRGEVKICRIDRGIGCRGYRAGRRERGGVGI